MNLALRASLTGFAWRVALAVGLASLTGCAETLGSFGSNGGLLGAWSVAPTACHSGVTDGVFGRLTIVWFARGRAGNQLSTGKHANGLTTVTVQRSTPYRSIDLRAEQCSRFEVQHVLQADGSLGANIELDCTPGDGGHVVASLHALSCR